MSPRRDGVQAGRSRALLASEQRSAALYYRLAEATSGEQRKVLVELAAVERKHAAHWAHKLTEGGGQVPGPARAGVRARILGWLAHLFSVAAVLPFLERAEHADAGQYQGDSDATAAMAIDERSHAPGSHSSACIGWFGRCTQHSAP
jgi:hypothetical protein